jgi:hypothetical protein
MCAAIQVINIEYQHDISKWNSMTSAPLFSVPSAYDSAIPRIPKSVAC